MGVGGDYNHRGVFQVGICPRRMVTEKEGFFCEPIHLLFINICYDEMLHAMCLSFALTAGLARQEAFPLLQILFGPIELMLYAQGEELEIVKPLGDCELYRVGGTCRKTGRILLQTQNTKTYQEICPQQDYPRGDQRRD